MTMSLIGRVKGQHSLDLAFYTGNTPSFYISFCDSRPPMQRTTIILLKGFEWFKTFVIRFTISVAYHLLSYKIAAFFRVSDTNKFDNHTYDRE